jgi:hypothetical protein
MWGKNGIFVYILNTKIAPIIIKNGYKKKISGKKLYVSIRVCICEYTYIRMNIRMYVYVSMQCMCVYTYIRMNIRMDVCNTYVRIYMLRPNSTTHTIYYVLAAVFASCFCVLKSLLQE